MIRRLFILSGLLALSCAKPLSQLDPYPCAADLSCPEGLACVAGVCDTPVLDAICTAETRCAEAGAGAACSSYGICATSCTNGSGCGPDRVCSTPTGAGTCLASCTNGEACPERLECQPLWVDGEKGCMKPAGSVAACAGFATSSQCNFCQDSASWSVACGGFTCPRWSTCGSNNMCNCPSWTTAVDCTGTKCSSTHPCSAYNWWCQPNYALTSSCTSTPIPAAGTCQCRDGRQLLMDCGYTQSCEERCSVGCDAVKQDCTDPANPKCSFVTSGADTVARCVPRTGSGALGQACTRVAQDASGVGRDDCASGLFCSGLSLASGRVCRTLCSKTADCGAGQGCLELTTKARPAGGMCFASCTLFGACGGGGQSCTPAFGTDVATTTYCRASGTGTLGTVCTRNEDCVANSWCFADSSGQQLTCHAVCDASHACPSPKTCYPAAPLANGGGICL